MSTFGPTNTSDPTNIVSVTPWPLSQEISQPFSVTPQGAINAVIDPVQRVIQHILSVALTAPGERPMRPTYGVGLRNMVFSDSPPKVFQHAATALQQALTTTDSGYTITSSQAIQSAGNAWQFLIQFQLNGSNVVHEAVFDWTGTLVGYT